MFDGSLFFGLKAVLTKCYNRRTKRRNRRFDDLEPTRWGHSRKSRLEWLFRTTGLSWPTQRITAVNDDGKNDTDYDTDDGGDNDDDDNDEWDHDDTTIFIGVVVVVARVACCQGHCWWPRSWATFSASHWCPDAGDSCA